MAADLLSTIRAEIEQRLTELRPLMAEYEELRSAEDALGTRRGPRKPPSRAAAAARPGRRPGRPRKAAPRTGGSAARRSRAGTGAPRGPRSAAAKAVVAALEHGSHTVAELAVVSGLSDRDVRAAVRPLLKGSAIVKVRREGRTAYALAGPARHGG